MKRPSFQFYPADWLKDPALRACSRAARSLWIDLMCLMHEAEPYGHLMVNGRPMTEPEAARSSGEPLPAFRRLLGELERAGVPSRTPEGALFSRRMVRDERFRTVRAACGKMGGNPKLKDKPDHKQKVRRKDKVKPTPSSSPSGFTPLPPTATAAAASPDGPPLAAPESGPASPPSGPTVSLLDLAKHAGLRPMPVSDNSPEKIAEREEAKRRKSQQAHEIAARSAQQVAHG